MRITNEALIRDSGVLDEVSLDARQHDIRPSCRPSACSLLLRQPLLRDRHALLETAWQLFGNTPPGWARVQAICDYVHEHLTFGYKTPRPTKTALDVLRERAGVCRDFAHLAITFCRCMNIPARYCTGYLGDIGVPPIPAPMDFSAWFEVYLGGRWYTFDARHNAPRIGRILMARGRDAADVAISNSFGLTTLAGFEV